MSEKMATRTYSSQLWLPRMWHGIRHYEKIRKHEEEEEIPSEEQKEISSETGVTVAGRKARRLFKLSRRRPRARRSRRARFVLGIRRPLRWATLLSQLKVSWRRFAKLAKESQPHFADLFAGNNLLLHLTPPPPFYWYNHFEGVQSLWGSRRYKFQIIMCCPLGIHWYAEYTVLLLIGPAGIYNS